MSSTSSNNAATTESTTTTTESAKGTSTSTNNTKAFIFLHGLGDTPRGWSEVKHTFGSSLEDHEIKWIFPAAPTAPVTISGGARQTSWFDIFDWPIGLSARDDPKGLMESVEQTMKLIESCEEEGIQAKNIILGGFSQGGAIALLTCWRYPRQLGGCISLSGWLTLRDTFVNDKIENNNTPLFWGHGNQDQVVLPEQVPEGVKIIKSCGIPVDQEMYPIGHSSCPQEMNDVLDFMKKVYSSA
jgi:predicted esterase